MKKLVIELDEKFYKYVCEEVKSDELVYQAIQNGIPLEEELEKIKAEIGKCSDYVITNHNNTEADMNKLDGIILATTIIDTEISELKGENNEETNNRS